jgi:hypothetical protein
LRIAREAKVLNLKLQTRLETLKEERDWLVHRSVYQNAKDLYEENKRLALILRIQEFSEEALTLLKLIAKELEDFVGSQGVSRQQVLHIALETLSKLEGKKI